MLYVLEKRCLIPLVEVALYLVSAESQSDFAKFFLTQSQYN